MKKFLFLISLALLSNTSSANCDSVSCNTKIRTIYPTAGSGGEIFIEPDVSASVSSSVNCTRPEGRFFTLRREHVSFKEIYALLLAAELSDRVVRLRIQENSNTCDLSYV